MVAACFLAVPAVGAAAPFEPTAPHAAPCNYSEQDVRRIDFLTVYQAAHQAQLAAICFNDDPAVTRLDAELDAVRLKAQQRNPDVDLSTMEASTGLGVCHMSRPDIEAGCAANRDDALGKFSAAMTELRKFTARWG